MLSLTSILSMKSLPSAVSIAPCKFVRYRFDAISQLNTIKLLNSAVSIALFQRFGVNLLAID